MVFLEEDKQRFKDELDCYEYCIRKSEEAASTGNYGEAAAYLENSLRSLKELQRLSTKKRQQDELEKIAANLSIGDINIIFKMG